MSRRLSTALLITSMICTVACSSAPPNRTQDQPPSSSETASQARTEPLPRAEAPVAKPDQLEVEYAVKPDETKQSKSVLKSTTKTATRSQKPRKSGNAIAVSAVSSLKPVKPVRDSGSVLQSQASREDPNWLYALGRAAYLRGKYAKAQQLLSRAIDISPNVGEYFFRRALCYASRGDHDKALEDYKRAVQLDPKYREDLRLADELAKIYREQALENISTGKDAHVVLVDYKRATNLNPLSPELDQIPNALLTRIRQDAVNRNHTRALADAQFIQTRFQDAISLESVSDVYVQRGSKAMANQIYSSAKREFEMALAVVPNQQRVKDLIFECERLLRDPTIQKSAKKFKGNVDDLAEVKINELNYQRFVDVLRKLQRERARMKNKPVKEQKRILRQASDLEKRIWTASIKAANEAFRRDQVEDAYEHVVLALSIAPSDKRRQTAGRKQIIGDELALVLVKKARGLKPRQWRQAKEYVERALTVSPEFKPAKDWLAERQARLSGRSNTDDAESSGLDQFLFVMFMITVVAVLVYLLFGDTVLSLLSSKPEAPQQALISSSDPVPDDGDYRPDL